MLLKSIELHGFKSFPRKSLFEFISPISAVVGPNGSGKSNVAEAFQFVLGEQSIKSLRGKKGEDLIWNGGADFPRANRASVKVLLDNSNKFLNIDFPEVAIERVVHRDGVNEYIVNGSQVRLRDIIELLAPAHIGASGHHIISQGEADRVLSANPRERREMIEDALGLKIYQYKRQESERKLEKTLENISQVDALRKEIAPHLRFLKKQAEKIEKAAELKERLKTFAKKYLKRESCYLEWLKREIEKTKRPLEAKKAALERELNEARRVLEQSKMRDAKSDEVVSLEGKIQSLRKRKDGLLRDIGRLQGEIASEERALQREREIVSSDKVRTVPLRELEELQSDLESKISQAEQSNEISFIKSVLRSIHSLFSSFVESKKGERHDSLIRESEAELTKLKAELQNKETELTAVSEEGSAFERKYGTLRAEIEQEKDTNRDAEKTLFRITSEQSAVVGELALLRSKEEQLRVLEEDFKRELEECALLAGREALEYGSVSLDESAALQEERAMQEERRRVIEKVKIQLEESGLSGSGELLKEYQETSERDSFLGRELEDLGKSAEALEKLISELGEKLDQEFKTGVGKINAEFQKFFALMFGGGQAELKVTKNKKRKTQNIEESIFGDETLAQVGVEEEVEEEEGIDIEVSLPRKKIKGLTMLSGGERALTSIALLFAMSAVNPPPFIVLDETDAALDEANSKKYGDMIEDLSERSQLILITHNRETMSRAGVIYGVTMGQSGVSKMLSIQFEEAVAVAK
ncbi:hypothetical protein EPN83_01740 [Patescibacteria group bacterium]|nr:MAG: hypothetical protein EPN83_01740 [Patescibacteria group bacterium]